MSIKLMNEAWETDASGNDLLVLLALCDFSNDEGLSYPSLKTLADKAKVSKSTLSYILRAYEEIGVITREKRKRDNKSDTSTMYKINSLNFDIKSYKKAYQKARKYVERVHNVSTVNSQCEHGVNTENNLNVNTGVFSQCEHLYEPSVIKKRVSKDTPKKDLVNSNKSEFTPPTREEILNYVTEHKLCVDIEKFIKYYTASNWRDNKGKQVKNWKLKLITWDTSKEERHKQQDLSTIPLEQIKDLDTRMQESERRRQANIAKWEADNGIF